MRSCLVQIHNNSSCLGTLLFSNHAITMLRSFQFHFLSGKRGENEGKPLSKHKDQIPHHDNTISLIL